MNDTYAINPKAPENLQDLAALLRLFGASEGRFIVDYPNNWMNYINENLKECSPIEHLKLIETWLQKKRNAVIPINEQFRSNWSWSENVSQLNYELKNVIGTRNCPANQISINRVLYDPDVIPDSRSL